MAIFAPWFALLWQVGHKWQYFIKEFGYKKYFDVHQCSPFNLTELDQVFQEE